VPPKTSPATLRAGQRYRQFTTSSTSLETHYEVDRAVTVEGGDPSYPPRRARVPPRSGSGERSRASIKTRCLAQSNSSSRTDDRDLTRPLPPIKPRARDKDIVAGFQSTGATGRSFRTNGTRDQGRPSGATNSPITQ